MAARALLVALTVGTTAYQARAQAALWTDGSSDHKLSNNANWSGNVGPSPGGDVEFDGSTSSSNIIFDLPSFTLGTVNFDYANNAYVLGPSNASNVLTLTGGINDSSNAQITVTTNLSLGAAIQVQNENANLLITGNVSGSGSAEIRGESPVTLTGQNTYTGGTTIDEGGTLIVGNGVTTGTTFTSDVSNYGYLKFSPASSDTYGYTGVISGEGEVEINGAGKVIFSGHNSYYGATYVYGGILADGAACSFSKNSDLTVGTSGSVQVNYNEKVGSIQNGGSGGGISIANGVTLTSYGDDYGSGGFTGVISGLGSLVIDGNTGNGLQGLAGNNTFSGGVHLINDAEVFIGSNNALGTGTITFEQDTEFAPTAAVTLANPIVLNGSGYIDNDDGGAYNVTLTGPITGTGGLAWCTTGVLTLSNANNTFSGGLDVRTGVVNVVTTGATGSNTIYIDSGATLLISNGITVSNGLYFTGSGGLLSGNGTVSSFVTVNGGSILNPTSSNGSGIGNLKLSGGVAIDTGATINFNVYDANGAAGTGYSTITSTGGISFGADPGSITLKLISVDSSGYSAPAINFSSGNAYSWTVLSSTSSLYDFNPNMFSISTSNFTNGLGTGTFSVAAVGNNLVLDFTPVPEPSTWALMGLGLAALIPAALRHRRRAARA